MIMAAAVLWIPLIGSCVAGLISFFNQRTMDDLAKLVTCMCMGVSALIALDLVYDVIVAKKVVHGEMLSWIPLDDRHTITWGLYVDSLSAIMAAVVTIVSFMVHIYSLGYMKGDKSIARFMSYLSLFTFFMLFLVMSDDLLQLFLGWEGVGLSSYLLIGFWFQKESANAASMKAFITNRIGDMGMVLGIVGCIAVFDSVSIPEILSKLSTYDQAFFRLTDHLTINAYTFICACFLIGAMAKSAQFGLHVWLPDAMEGPTPVSALIHAATMVTAGVFLLIRLSFLFEYAPSVKIAIVVIGAITALFAAVVGLFQKDIKRVIAYSTCSQLGYMFMACGVSMYSAALFHLVTHAFFKALLFLSAGSVIHAMSGEQNMRKMGGLYKQIPVTYALVWVGSLALAGIPLFSGYYSKDWILDSLFGYAMEGGSIVPYVVGLSVAFLTAFYSWRLISLVFHGDCKADERVQSHIHEAPMIMLIPKVVLAVGAVFSGVALVGFFTKPQLISGAYVFTEIEHHMPMFIQGLPVVVALSGIVLAVWIYHTQRHKLAVCLVHFKRVAAVIQSGFAIDEIYRKVLIKPLHWLGGFLYHHIEKGLIDRYGSNGFALFIGRLGRVFRHMQTGSVRDYAIIMIAGLMGILGYVVVIIK
ncbi:NADH-quinone oxidoreductase subunit L [Candidatus Bodocaedibacter vickermanii]|uniref:NADH-quinone oxidoreductase subunit L n=1 Tax=Candidatus Bodocaedibacter vickermanii TaxID=2741701 RepID=A0A7L9RTH7_9PROT|nr:NADH-quinone oxidoreductase subunit L [Candidatus Paracaedibacteraceae bacterium 'Lake Konstanz']